MLEVKNDRRNTRAVTGRFRESIDLVSIILLAVFFLLGACVGCVVSRLSPALETGEFLLNNSVHEIDLYGFFKAFWSCAKYPFLALVIAGSVYGAFLVPLLCAFRGYLLSCAVASLSSIGKLYSLIVVGLPALFTVPCLFLLSSDSLVLSRRLISFGTCGWLSPRMDLPLSFHCMFSAGLLMIATLVQLLLVPKLAFLLN